MFRRAVVVRRTEGIIKEDSEASHDAGERFHSGEWLFVFVDFDSETSFLAIRRVSFVKGGQGSVGSATHDSEMRRFSDRPESCSSSCERLVRLCFS